MKEKPYISYVVYTYRQSHLISKYISMVDKYLNSKFDNYEIIVVCDDSDEETTRALSKISDTISGKLISINMAWKQKHELAMLAGTDFAIGDFIYEVESIENDYPLSIIFDLYDKCISGYDIVSASPDCNIGVSSKLFYGVLKRFSKLDLDLSTETIKIISRRALNAALNYKEKIRYRKVLYRYLGLPFTNLCYKSSKPGVKKAESFSERVSLGIEVLLSFSEIGLRVSFIFSIIFLIISFAVGVYAITIYLADKNVMAGWTTTMLFLSIGFSGIFMTLAILGKYITMVLQETKQTPPYVVKTVMRINSEK